jgi:hypothetical protein
MRLPHDLARRPLVVFDSERRRRPDERRARGRVGEAAELPVLEQPVGVGLGRDQPHLQIGQAGADECDGEAAPADCRSDARTDWSER